MLNLSLVAFSTWTSNVESRDGRGTERGYVMMVGLCEALSSPFRIYIPTTTLSLIYCTFYLSGLATRRARSSPSFVLRSCCFSRSVPDTPYPVRGEHRLCLDTLDTILALLDPLGQIPKEKVDEHATHALPRAPIRAQRSRDALDRHDRRSAYGHLLARRGAGPELGARLEQADERGRVGQEPEVVQDLRDAVVGEHRQLRDPPREERVRVLVGPRGEGRPGLRDEDLGAFPEEDWVESRPCEYWYGGGSGEGDAMSAVLTSASLEPVLVSEGREGIRDHLHELQRRAIVVVTSLERLYESLKRPAVFLDRAYRYIQQGWRAKAHPKTHSAKDRTDLSHDGDALR
jgi:hypothetical protein